MIVQQIARMVADFTLFLDLTDDDTLDPDEAVSMMEVLAGHLQGMETDFLRQLIDAFEEIAPEYTGEAQKLVREIPSGYYLEEALAGDDPVRLAELQALRDARED